jgi:hypothetical protein
MVQNSALKSIFVDCALQVLGTEIAATDLDRLQASAETLAIAPGSSFWHANEARAGIHIVLAGKVRLFDLQEDRLATLTVGKSFGASTLFPAAEFSPYIAKAALVVGGSEISLCYLPGAAICELWDKYPQIRAHLRQRAEHLEAVITGISEPSALRIQPQGLQPLDRSNHWQLLPPQQQIEPHPHQKLLASDSKPIIFPLPPKKWRSGGAKLHAPTHFMPSIARRIAVRLAW